MQGRGLLKRPLWTIIKSIGSGSVNDSVGNTYPKTSARIIARCQSAAVAVLEGQEAASTGSSLAAYGTVHDREDSIHSGSRQRLHNSLLPKAKGVIVRSGTLRTEAAARGSGGKGGTLAKDEGETPSTIREVEIKRVIGNEERTRAYEQLQEEHWRHAADGAFDADVQSGSRRSCDRFDLKCMRKLRENGNFTRGYSNAYQTNVEDRMKRRHRRHQIHEERHPTGSKSWTSILKLLDDATPAGADKHRRRTEIVRLPEGVRAVFKGNSGEAILEVMKRTGSHVQMLPAESFEHGDGLRHCSRIKAPPNIGFEALTLWGTAEENLDAIRILPTLTFAFNETDEVVSATAKELVLRSEVAQTYSIAMEGSSQTKDSEEKTHDGEYWREQENLDGVELEALEDAVGDITHAIGNVRAPLRAIWRRGKTGLRTTSVERLRTRPEAWTTLNFAAYVEDLVAPAPRLLRRQSTHISTECEPPTLKYHVQIISDELQAILLDPHFVQYLSSDAVDDALRFFIRHRNVPAVRRLFIYLENSSYRLTASNFDTLLAAVAHEENVYTFRYVVRLMLRRGISPTWRTWVSLHDLVSRRFPPDAIRAVEERMRMKGILAANPQVAREVAANAVEIELRSHLNNPAATAETFFDSYDQLHGTTAPGPQLRHNPKSSRATKPRHWLTTSAANRIAKVFLSQGRVPDAMTTIANLHAAGEKSNIVTLNTFLASAMRARDARMTITVLQNPLVCPLCFSSGMKLDGISFGLLFTLAWRTGCHNMLRVIWRYACMSGNVNWSMQRRIRESLISYPPNIPTSVSVGATQTKAQEEGDQHVGARKVPRTAVSSFWAAKLAVGVSQGLDYASTPTHAGSLIINGTDGHDRPEHLDMESNQVLQALSQSEDEMVSLASQPRTQNDEKRDEHRQRRTRLYELFQSDLVAPIPLQPEVDLVEILERAWEKDMEWKQEGRGLLRGLEMAGLQEGLDEEQAAGVFASEFTKMMEGGIRVPVRHVQQ